MYRLIGWILYAENDDIEEVEYNLFDLVTKSKDLDFDERSGLYRLVGRLITSPDHYDNSEL